MDQREALYTHVEEHRESLVPDASASKAARALQDIQLDTTQLIRTMREQAAAA